MSLLPNAQLETHEAYIELQMLSPSSNSERNANCMGSHEAEREVLLVKQNASDVPNTY